MSGQGASLPVLINAEFGGSAKRVTNFLCLTLLVMVGVVFVKGPAGLLAETTLGIEWTNLWAAAIFAYYVVATLVPVDKIIGRLYPVFGAVLILMTTGLSVGTLNSGHRFPALQALPVGGCFSESKCFLTETELCSFPSSDGQFSLCSALNIALHVFGTLFFNSACGSFLKPRAGSEHQMNFKTLYKVTQETSRRIVEKKKKTYVR